METDTLKRLDQIKQRDRSLFHFTCFVIESLHLWQRLPGSAFRTSIAPISHIPLHEWHLLPPAHVKRTQPLQPLIRASRRAMGRSFVTFVGIRKTWSCTLAEATSHTARLCRGTSPLLLLSPSKGLPRPWDDTRHNQHQWWPCDSSPLTLSSLLSRQPLFLHSSAACPPWLAPQCRIDNASPTLSSSHHTYKPAPSCWIRGFCAGNLLLSPSALETIRLTSFG